MTMAGRVNEGQVGAGTNGTSTDRALLDLATSEADEAWLARTRVFLQPIAAPSIMGLFGFAIATAMVGAWQAGWYGNANTGTILWPFALFAGGLLQSIAAVVSFKARDGVAVAMHTIWGAFWLGWGLLMALASTHLIPMTTRFGTSNKGFAFWFIMLAAITISGTFAALAESGLLTAVLGSLAAGASFTAAGYWIGSLTTTEIGGWLFVASAALAYILATGMMLEGSTGRAIIPLGKWSKDANVPGRQTTRPIERATGMPGVRAGQ